MIIKHLAWNNTIYLFKALIEISSQMEPRNKNINESTRNLNETDLLRLSFKKSLNLSDLITSKNDNPSKTEKLQCLFCNLDEFHLSDLKSYLGHLLREHQFVIGDVDQIGNFPK